MSSSFGKQSGQDVDINITPVIDCFTVLITFLLASASFLSIGFFEVSTPGPSVQEQKQEPDIEVILKVRADQSVILNWKGRKTGSKQFDLQNAGNLEELKLSLRNLRSEGGHFTQILISAEDVVPYSAVARVMDQVQSLELPVVMGDFQ